MAPWQLPEVDASHRFRRVQWLWLQMAGSSPSTQPGYVNYTSFATFTCINICKHFVNHSWVYISLYVIIYIYHYISLYIIIYIIIYLYISLYFILHLQSTVLGVLGSNFAKAVGGCQGSLALATRRVIFFKDPAVVIKSTIGKPWENGGFHGKTIGTPWENGGLPSCNSDE